MKMNTSMPSADLIHMAALQTISPIDGRYAPKTQILKPYFSEMALQKARISIEIAWLKQFSACAQISEVPVLSINAEKALDNIIQNFSEEDALRIKTIEATTNHDVKACEYFLKEKMALIPELKSCSEFIHFACTSEDINNLAYATLISQARTEILVPQLQLVLSTLTDMGKRYATIAMLARTHGQAATPTTVGKELINFAARMKEQIRFIKDLTLTGKCNGATGNFSAHFIAYPEIDWPTFSAEFIQKLGLEYNAYTTQIEPHDRLCVLLQALQRNNSILIDLCRDAWGYIALGYFGQKKQEHEVGSSTMPHKINPIDFENAEGNFGIANSLIHYCCQQLPTSRWQRDLVDSTVLRNIGVIFAHTLIALQSLQKGLQKIEVNVDVIEHDLSQHWAVLTEAVQTVMRRYGLNEGYEQLKALSRGLNISEHTLQQFIAGLALPETVKQNLLQLTPGNYFGLAAKLVDQF